MKAYTTEILVFIGIFFILYMISNIAGYFACKNNTCGSENKHNCYPNKCKFWGLNYKIGKIN